MSATAQPTARPVNFWRVVRSEFIKFRSLRTTWILLGSTVVVMVGLAALFALGVVQSAGTENPIPPQFVKTIATSGGIGFAMLIIASFGAVFIAGEYATGMIRSTMTAVPGRISPLVAKAVIMAIAAFLVGIVSAFIAFFVAQPILATQDMDFSLSTDGVIGSIFGGGLFLAIIAVLGLSIGALLRNTPASVVTVIGLLFVVSIIVELIPLDFFDDLLPYLPDQAGSQMTMIDTQGDTLNQWQGGLVCLAWAVVAHIAALILVKTRDV